MDALEILTPEQQQKFMAEFQLLQIRDNGKMYNDVVHRCYDKCVGSFRSKTLEKDERSCLDNCASRFIKGTQRVGRRFAERQQALAAQQQQQEQLQEEKKRD
mmetsp:Transcript_26985/g.53908  ORF Transcript_26985/g.53908 Transcript_26985/m.53908 type:complete len:102 (-) Transcript_26985:39-344(-)